MLHGNLSVKEEITQTKCFRTTKNKTRRPCKKTKGHLKRSTQNYKKKKRQKLGRKKKVHLIYLIISPTTTEQQHFSTVGN